MATIGGRLDRVRENMGLTVPEMADKLGVSTASYYNYKGGKRDIPGKILQKLSEMGYNINWILTGHGEMKDREYQIETTESKIAEENGNYNQNFGDRLKIAIKISRFNQQEVAEMVGISENTLTNYINNRSEPKQSVLLKLSKLLEVSCDFLVKGEMKNQKVSEDLKNQLRRLIKEEQNLDFKLKDLHKTLSQFDNRRTENIIAAFLDLNITAPE